MTVADICRRTAEAMGEPPAGDRMPCLWCAEPTDRATLSMYGARCRTCYEAYRRAPHPPGKPPARTVRRSLFESIPTQEGEQP